MEFAKLARTDGKPVRFMLVDDSAFARRNMGLMVQAFGGEIAGEAPDGAAALLQYEQVRPDMVLMDVTMPNMHGIQTVERLVQRHPEALVIMVSSVGSKDNVLLALEKGARHFVQKPVKAEVLYEIIKYVLEQAANKSVAATAGR